MMLAELVDDVEADEDECLSFFGPNSTASPCVYHSNPEVLALEQKLSVEPISREELVMAQQEDKICRRYYEDSKTKYSLFETEADGLLVRVWPIDGARQKVVPTTLQARVLYLAHYPLMAGHPQGSKM